MAKIKLQSYVKLLHSLLDQADQTQIESQFAGFLCLVRKNHQLKNLNEIIRLYGEQRDESQNMLTARVYSAQALTDEQKTQIINFLQDRYQPRQVNLLTFIQPTQNAGILIETKGERYDWTLSRQLDNFARHLSLN